MTQVWYNPSINKIFNAEEYKEWDYIRLYGANYHWFYIGEL